MINEENKRLMINKCDTKLQLKQTFKDLSSEMIESYDKEYLSKEELKLEIISAWQNTLIKAREIDEKIIIENCLNDVNKKLKNQENPSASTSDPADKEIITALEKEIKELNETIEILEKKMLDAKSRNYKLLNQISDLEENAAPGTPSHNARGAGRKPKITPEQIAMIQMLRAQGKKLQEIQTETGISYGNIQKYCKLITDKNKNRAGS